MSLVWARLEPESWDTAVGITTGWEVRRIVEEACSCGTVPAGLMTDVIATAAGSGIPINCH